MKRVSDLWVFAFLFVTTVANGGSDKQSEAYRDSVCAVLPEAVVSSCKSVRPSHAHYAEAPKGSVNTKGGVTITTSGGKTLSFETVERPELPYPEPSHHFLGFLPKYQYFVVLGIYGSGEVSRIGLVANRTGEVFWLEGNIFISPSGDHIFTIPHSPGTTVLGGAIYSVTAEAITKVAQINFGNCSTELPAPCTDVLDAIWVSPTEIVAFSLDYKTPPMRVMGQFLVRIFRDDEHWKTRRLLPK